jgi:hypothetical protein
MAGPMAKPQLLMVMGFAKSSSYLADPILRINLFQETER